jgi:hypothetical protein
MVHNGIEYGLMASYAEGLNILKNANAGTVSRQADAETAPRTRPPDAAGTVKARSRQRKPSCSRRERSRNS